MLDVVYIWIATAFIFLLASVFGEGDMRFGVVLVPLFAGLFWLVGWLPQQYVAGALSVAVTLGIVTFLKEQYRRQFGAGSLGGFTIWKIMFFVVCIQFAIVLCCSLSYSFGAAGPQYLPTVNTTMTQSYTLTNAQTVYGNLTHIDSIDYVTTGLAIGWTAFNGLFALLWGVFGIIPTLTNVFHVPIEISTIIGGCIYLLLAVEVYTLLVYRVRPPTL